MEFTQLTQESYRATLERWRWEAEKYDVFPHEVERRLAWVGEALQTPSPEHLSMGYGVFLEGEVVAAAVCELVLSRKSASETWLKLLSVTLSPELEALVQDGDLEAMKSAITVYRTAVVGSFGVKFERSADTLKLYGRNAAMLQLLTALLATLESTQDSLLEARKEGRWLVLRPNLKTS